MKARMMQVGSNSKPAVLNSGLDSAEQTLPTTGRSAPLGASVEQAGVNFSVYSRDATRMDLLLFGSEDAPPSRVIHLDLSANRTYHYWHVFVPGLQPGQLYGYRVHGPFDPPQGLRFDASKVLLDPYGREVVVPIGYSRDAAARDGYDNAAISMKSVVVDPHTYDWEGDAPLHRSSSHTVIYEMHVGGFTRHPNSGLPANTRGTFAGLIEKIPYLQDLGITAVELLPVFQFDAQDCPPGHVNYWGYQPVSFFAPHRAYSSRQGRLGPVDEFRDMVKALHRSGIEVILDVVYNHTSEGDSLGPTLNLRGLDNNAYYILEGGSRYANYTGTGNTLNGNHTIVRRMIVDSLRYWVEEMHVDGFRFDLASILTRDSSGHSMANPPVLWDIETDPAMAGIKFIAEAWDAAGLYQVGSFIGDSWKEWNGRFRDDIRSFFRSEDGTVTRFADRFLGSPELYGHKKREAEQSVNFVTCHDGFTLNDLVSYERKHNEPNGEANRDGADDNRSWNCGTEGPTDDRAIETLRNRQVKNFLTVTLLALGVPMVLMGDEVRRTQRGNNNAYSQDNEISWFDWGSVEKHADVYRFLKLLIARRLLRDFEAKRERKSLEQLLFEANKTWHGVKVGQPDWSPTSHSLAFSAEIPKEKLMFYIAFNSYWEDLEFELPSMGLWADNPWRRWIDTSLDSPADIADWYTAESVPGLRYSLASRSVVVLFARCKT
jgi:isoamylase